MTPLKVIIITFFKPSQTGLEEHLLLIKFMYLQCYIVYICQNIFYNQGITIILR